METNKLVIWLFIIFLALAIANQMGYVDLFTAAGDNPTENLGDISIDSSNFNGNYFTLNLSKTSSNWNTWDYFDWNYNDIIFSGASMTECYMYGGTWNINTDECYKSSSFNLNQLRSSNVRLEISGQSYPLDDFSVSSLRVDNIPEVIGSGTLKADFVLEIMCVIGDEKCNSDRELLVCEAAPFNVTWWDYELSGYKNLWKNKGVVQGKCEPECNSDDDCHSEEKCVEYFCINKTIEELYLELLEKIDAYEGEISDLQDLIDQIQEGNLTIEEKQELLKKLEEKENLINLLKKQLNQTDPEDLCLDIQCDLDSYCEDGTCIPKKKAGFIFGISFIVIFIITIALWFYMRKK